MAYAENLRAYVRLTEERVLRESVETSRAEQSLVQSGYNVLEPENS